MSMQTPAATDVAVGSPPAQTSVAASAGMEPTRFGGVDAMRGVAAMAVVVYHLVLAVNDKSSVAIPWLRVLGYYGRFGVEVFFVLSGFVIAHSTRDGDYSLRYLGRFALRRAIRLDIPYWATIAIEVVLLLATGYFMVQYTKPLPSAPQIAANLLYVQTFLGYQHIVPICWSLCYEVQFYAILVIGLIVLRKLDAFPGQPTARSTWTAVLLALSFLTSLAIFATRAQPLIDGLFADRWFQFSLGVIAYYCIRGHLPYMGLLAAVGVCVPAAFLAEDSDRSSSIIACLISVGMVLASIRLRSVHRVAMQPLLQWLGRLSYSIYLLHLSIGWRAVVAFNMLCPIAAVPLALAALGVGIVATMLMAWLMHLALEEPALKLAHRVSLPRTAR